MEYKTNTNLKILNKPFLRWTGGKNWLVPYFSKIISKIDFNNYHEPFLGGGSIYFSLNNQKKAYLSDFNDELINCYKQVRDQPTSLIRILSGFPQNKDYYYKIRESSFKSKLKMAARFIYLNKTSFNGIDRVNSSGKYNVPYGKKSFDHEKISELIKSCSLQLKNANLISADFKEFVDNVKKNDLVYLDPPYTITHNNNGFIKYNEKLFSFTDQIILSTLIAEIRKKRAYYILSNAYHPDVKKIYDKFGDKVIALERISLISAKAESRENYKEYIFTNIK